MTEIRFSATPYQLEGQTILRLPEEASAQLPSRGQVAVKGKINDHEFTTVLEPDGYWGHFVKISTDLQRSAGINQDEDATLELTVTKEWPEPDVPDDFVSALEKAPEKVRDKWKDITPMARWEWIRWVNATSRDETRAIRIEKSISKLNGKHRRPCCFNLAACTDPELSRSGRLMGVVTNSGS